VKTNKQEDKLHNANGANICVERVNEVRCFSATFHVFRQVGLAILVQIMETGVATMVLYVDLGSAPKQKLDNSLVTLQNAKQK
jgi:hypothetical protein